MGSTTTRPSRRKHQDSLCAPPRIDKIPLPRFQTHDGKEATGFGLDCESGFGGLDSTVLGLGPSWEGHELLALVSRIHSSASMSILAGVVLLVIAGCEQPAPVPKVVAPSKDAALDPYLQTLIQKHVQQARRQPENANLHGTLGMIYEANELWDLAIASYANGTLLNPEYPDWRNHHGICLMGLGKFDEAEEVFRELVLDHPDFAPAWYRLGRAKLHRGDVEAALQDFRKCLSLVERNVAAQAAVAECLVRKKDYQAAVTILEPITRARPNFAHARYNLGLAYRGLGQREKAVEQLKDVNDSGAWHVLDTVDQRIPNYKAGLSEVMARALDILGAGRPAEAATLLEEVSAAHPNEVSVLNNLSSVYQEQKRFPEALKLLGKALDLQPQNFRTHINKASCLFSMGQVNQAIDSAEDAVSLAPQVALAHMTLARCLIVLRRLPEARLALSKVVELEPNHIKAHLAMGEVATMEGRTPDAITHFEEVIRLDPKHTPSYVNAGLLSLRTGQLAKAEEKLKQAMAIQPDHPRVRTLAQRIEQAKTAQQRRTP